MRLREFGLTASLGERVSPHTLAHRFSLETRCVAALFERVLPKFSAARGWKVLVECVPEVRDGRILDQLGVLTVQRAFDVPGFLASPAADKKRLTLEILWEGIVEVARAEGWSLEPFEAARRAVLDLGYANRWSWPKRPVAHRPSGRRGQLHCEHDVDAFRAWLVLTDKGGAELVRRLVLEKPPSEFQFVPSLGSLRWEGPDRMVLRASDESVVAEVSRLAVV